MNGGEENTIANVPDYVAGIDLGSDTSVVCKISTRSLKTDIMRNSVSNEKTPMSISFSGLERVYGEVADQMKGNNRLNTADNLIRYLDYFHRSDDSQILFEPIIGRYETMDGYKKFVAEYAGSESPFTPEQLLAMFLRNLESFAERNIPIAVAVPATFGPVQVQAVRDAAKISGIDLRAVIRHSDAAMLDYGTKRSAEVLGQSCVCVVDVGHAYCSVAVYQWDGKQGKCLASKSVEGCGGLAMERVLFEALCKECHDRKKTPVAKGSKGSIRLMSLTRRLKENLSAVPTSSITCEMLVDDDDMTFTYTREKFANAASEITDKFKNLLQEVWSQCPEECRASLKTCELIGGAMRTPLIRDIVKEVLGEDIQLAYTMDSMSAISMGTAVYCASLVQPTTRGIYRPAFDNVAVLDIPNCPGVEDRTGTRLMSEEEIEQAIALEHQMQENDARVLALNNARNKLESYIYEMRGVVDGSSKFSELIVKDECSRILNEYDDWLYDAVQDNTAEGPETFTAKYDALVEALQPSCHAYWEKIKAEKQRTEDEMDREAAEAARELEASGGKDDHDTRKLKKPERMRKVVINKEEGNTLFKDGNFAAASNRYVRALQHCEKFFDLSPEDTKEVDAIKLSLYLNLAQCSIKLTQWDDTIKNANEALKIDGNSVKALYRLAFAQENTKDFDAAKQNLLKAAKVEPEDKAVAKLLDRVNTQIKREEAKRKKMAQKMFG